ncbi:MAG: PKD domain-containing protein [Paludibacteraceae bacterium]|nr:PKD domain-containing protein [Paludibacteraceae bacterium]
MKTKQNILLIALLAAACTLSAQVTYYSCDFETESQNQEWTLSAGQLAADIPHKWTIDTAENNTYGGSKAMYVSLDNGSTASYRNVSSYVIAYTTIYLEAGDYDFSFDWKALGYTLTDVEGLYVGWAPETDFLGRTINLNSNTSTTIGTTINNYILNLDNPDDNSTKTQFRGRSEWQTKLSTLSSDGEPRRLFFLWLSSQSAAINPGACIDNIEIVRKGACPAPTEVYINTDEEMNIVTLTWSGDAPMYEVRVFNHTTGRWTTRTVSDTTTIFNSLSEGKCDFYLRSLCDGNLRSVPYSNSPFIYYPANHCIDYLTLTDENCSFTSGFQQTTDTERPTWEWSAGKIDLGADNVQSQHVRIDSHDERDPYTGGMLLKVPANELASVKLGKEGTAGSHHTASRVKYKYHVDAEKSPVLLMRYAVVLQEPGHDIGKSNSHQDPRFTLKVLDSSGRSIGSCAEADFTSSGVDEANGWYMFQPETGSSLQTTKIVWKDWTTVGVNLSEYDGQDLTVQLTSYDCAQGGHFGYAYFTLGCSNGSLSGMSCGQENTEFVAPDGFRYRWFKASAENQVHNPLLYRESYIESRERVFSVDVNDTLRYGVDLMFEGDTTCYFTLYASSLPYFPVASMEYEYKPSGCKNIYQFTNTSHIKEYNKISKTEVHTNNKVDYVEWDFGDGTTSLMANPEHEYPQEGGLFTVTLRAYLGECEPDEQQFYVLVPKVGTQIDTLHVNACRADGYAYRDTTFTESTVYTDSLVSVIGCDSITVLDVNILDTLFTVVDTMIMNTETFMFNGNELSKQGTYTAQLKSEYGCDSIVTLHLFVHDVLKVDIDSVFTICADDGVLDMPYSFISGYSSTYSLKFSSPEIPDILNERTELGVLSSDLPTYITPNEYGFILEFYDSISGDLYLPLKLIVEYPSSVITQRWNDLLAVRNSDYNGGYEFCNYQWYKNGVPIDGEQDFYLYVPEGLDLDAEYSAMVTRATDSVSLFICPIELEDYSVVRTIPTLVEKRQPITMRNISGRAAWISFRGVTIDTVYFADNDVILAPGNEGWYILNVIEDGGTSRSYKVKVE